MPSAPHRAHLSVESVPGQRGAYSVGDSIVLYSRQDREARVEGTPRLAIKIGETVRFAHFAPWSGDVWPPERLQFQHQFVYEVHADDQDEDGISIAADAFDFAEGAFLSAAGEQVDVGIYKVTPSEAAPAVEPGRDMEMHRVAPGTLVPLEPLAAVTGVQVAERGQHFIVWQWDSVEGASGYDVDAFRAGTPDSERPSREFVTGPTFRKEGLEPGTAWEFFARAVRDTARGREVGPWSVGARRETWGEGEMWGEPRQCGDEREMALTFGTSWGSHRPVEAWDGEPIQVYFDEAAVRPEERGRVKEWFDGVERLSDVIHDQIGYSILELGGWIRKERRGFGMKTDRLSDCRPRRRQIVVTVVGWQDYASAHGACGAVLMPRSELFDGWSGDGVVAHEIWHLLGFTHHRKSGHPWQTPEGKGVQMSLELTHPSRDDRQDLSVTYEDVDALRCIFPEGG